MPCKGGFRGRIEEGKKRREREREHENSAERKYWLALIDRIYKTPEGIGGLSHAEKTYYAVSCLMGEVYNGGFEQYFSNSSGELYGLALDGLFEFGAEKTAGLLAQAKEVLFGDLPVPTDQSGRQKLMPTLGNDSHPAWGKLDVLDKAFYADTDQLTEKCAVYAAHHKLYKDS
ncbi:DMP19 family protein [Oxalicibacterium solurbis]|uniref:DNA mimic protein DMP19 C-terminal domain-containing protein n=1 Tax=Oxalicibacterium solurbis TaxID=69280 RepID=A0A8J3ATW2_9BURK|nr:DMP19 family protein [Oxalicibacterium solurbis]GGI53574.1 hypothetical protein GCM10011430_07480 [Oxalicibacterium solurbis]